MQHTFLHTAARAFTALVLFNLTSAAHGMEIANPIVHDNLAIYFVRDAGQSGPTPLTLDQALPRGAIRIHGDGPFTIENVSGQSVLIQLGDLLKAASRIRWSGRASCCRRDRIP
jgi:hypothetical protein